jgi:hypothetical protein
MADRLVTDVELASFLQKDIDTATAWLVIELATGKVQEAAGQRLVAATSTFLIDVPWGDCGPWLPLPQTAGPVGLVGADRRGGIHRLVPALPAVVAPGRLECQQLGAVAGDRRRHARLPRRGAGARACPRLRVRAVRAGVRDPGSPVQSEQIDDYRVTYAEADAAMQVTPYMRDQLRATYGTGVHVTASR